MQDLLNKIDRLLKEKKFFEVKNIVKDENAADLAVLFDELFGEVFGEKTEFLLCKISRCIIYQKKSSEHLQTRRKCCADWGCSYDPEGRWIH